MKKYLISILLLISPISLADDSVFFKYGLGLNNPYFPDTSVKFISIGYTGPLYKFFDYQIEGGAFVDNSQPMGVIGFTTAEIGIKTKEPGFYAGFFIGPALLTQTDTRLATLFEFSSDIELGIRDSRGIAISGDYKHFSNAGITQNNVGRDFFIIKLTLPVK